MKKKIEKKDQRVPIITILKIIYTL
jgi:hypothetical protein